MKKSQTRGQRLVWLCGLAFIVAGCDNPTNPTSPSAVPAPGAGIIAPLGVGAGPQTASTPIAVGAGPQTASTPIAVGAGPQTASAPIAVGAGPQTASALRGARPGKYTVCHMKASGTYVPIEVSGSAMAAHQAHDGDWMPEDGSCSSSDPPTDLPPVTLSCGAPTTEGGIPGSIVSPGPGVDTTQGGVFLGFAVTATPPPPTPTKGVREIFDTDANGTTSTTSDFWLWNGTYEQGVWTSGAVSFVREIRFTLDDASCSLFWNINPPSGS